jgi:purine nucleoside phosphorylase
MYTISDIIDMIENSGTPLLESEKQQALTKFDDVVSPYYRTYMSDVLEFLGM